MLTPFRHRFFLAVWTANLVSSFGAQIQGVGASWLMTTMTGSPQLVALVATATLLPVLLFALPFGAAADLFDRRKVLLTAQLLMFAASAILAVFAFADVLSPLLLLILTFLLGCGFALNNPAWQASVGELVPADDVPGAVSLNILGFNLSRTIAPAVGGLVIAAGGPDAAFAFNAVTYIGLIVVLALWRRPTTELDLPRENIAGAIGGGVRYLVHAHGVGRIILRASLYGLSIASIMSLMPLVVRELLGGTSEVFGILLGCAGFGAVLGAMIVGRLRALLNVEAILRWGHFITIVAILVAAFSRSVILTGFAQFLAGLGLVLSVSSLNIIMQLSVPRWIVGRAMSIFQMGASGGLAIGAWMWGGVAEAVGIGSTLQIAAFALLLFSLIGIRLPLIQPDPVLLRPGGRRFSRELPIGYDGGAPVSVLIEYRIAPSDRDEFLQLMRQRKQIRRREGVQRWSLSRGATDPECWIERYVRSNWTDFIRHRNRLSIEEEENLERIGGLHRGVGRPQVRFFVEQDVNQLRHVGA